MQIALIWWTILAVFSVHSIVNGSMKKIDDPEFQLEKTYFIGIPLLWIIIASCIFLIFYIIFVISYFSMKKFTHESEVNKSIWKMLFPKEDINYQKMEEA